ncbi:hypothetical protein KCP74_07345 [Salmonella enterica subsp. enterica]|nr:hypothetical protein KCP74_07345 [Salmonella enterica subsp. enterica]
MGTARRGPFDGISRGRRTYRNNRAGVAGINVARHAEANGNLFQRNRPAAASTSSVRRFAAGEDPLRFKTAA